MYYIICIHSSVEGHLMSFHLLAIINKAAMNFQILLDLPVVLCPSFWGTSRLISRVVVPVCSPTNNGGVFLFLYTLASICCHLNFLSDPFWLEWGRISGLFWFAFPWWLNMLNISLGAFQPSRIPQLRILCLALYPIFGMDYFVFWSLTSWVFYIFWILAICMMKGQWGSFPNP